jgi:transposase
MSLEQRIAELEAQLAERDARVAERETQLAERDARIAQLEKLLLQLQQQLEEAKRAGKRQATPFSRKKRKKDPKKPGRKKGQGKFTYRQPPSPEEINETKKEPVSCCPECGGRVGELKEHEHYEVDLPPIVPVITKYITYSGTCCDCGEAVQSRHPEQISEATGAAGTVIGPRAKALAVDLKHRLGLSYGKICELFGEAFGFE